MKKDCIINTYFIGENAVFYRLEYCRKNCNYKCCKGEDYKKKEDRNDK